MVSNGSSSGGGQSLFSLDSQDAVMRLLRAVRSSDLSSAQKNELRDLVFIYTNGGFDQTVKIQIEQKIAEYKLNVPHAAPVTDEKKANQPTIGTIRSAPSFAISRSEVAKAKKESIADSPSPATKASDTEPVRVKVSASSPTPTSEDTAPKTEDSTPEMSSAPESAAVPTPPQPLPESQPQAPVSPVESKPEPISNAPSADDNLTRIREIKALVNEKVGNPVHLVDLNPDVGREYMTALLEAMKKVNSGSVATSAMERLEAAFKAVEQIDAAGTSSAEPVASADATSQPVPAAPAQPEPKTVPLADVNKVVDTLTPKENREVIDTLTESTPPETPAPSTPPAPDPVASTPSYVPDTADNQNVPISGFDAATNREPRSVPIQSSARSGFSTGTSEKEMVQSASVAKAASSPAPVTPLSAMPSALPKKPTPEPVASSTPSDPLYSPAVDNGLEQLLEEWPIFKKSGLFGTGPKGREHPLFKKVSGLQIPLLLAGRFEGATQEIKQSITDYMNGWRYEQGIIYEQGETFEHYLRRVIKHILDLQKNRV